MAARSCTLAASVVLASTACGPAFAHAHLASATPAADAIASPPPTELQLRFTQDVVSDSSKITVTGPDRKAVTTGAIKQPNGSMLTVPLGAPLADGVYTVNWEVLCIDGEYTHGSYKFESMK